MDGSKTAIVVPLGDLGVLDNFTLITVRIDFNENPTTHITRESYTAYFRLNNKFSFYGVFKTGAGFWIRCRPVEEDSIEWTCGSRGGMSCPMSASSTH